MFITVDLKFVVPAEKVGVWDMICHSSSRKCCRSLCYCRFFSVVCFGKRTFIWFVCVRLWVNCCVHVSLGGIQCFVWFWTMELWSPETDNQKQIMFGVHWRQCASCSDGRSELFYCRNRKMGKTNSQDCVTFVSSVA